MGCGSSFNHEHERRRGDWGDWPTAMPRRSVSCATQCLTFAPYTALPAPPIPVVVAQAVVPVSFQIFGTGPFNISICGNAAYAVSGRPAIASIALVGNMLTVTPSPALAGDAGIYQPKLCITNIYCCAPFEVPLQVVVT